MERTNQEVSAAEVLEHLRRFLPPGQPDAFLDGAEFVVRWLPSPDAWALDATRVPPRRSAIDAVL